MDNVNIQISQDLIKPIIENKIKMAIIEAMGGNNELIAQTVDAIFKLKVDSSGNKSRYDSDNKFNFIDVVLKQGIETACKEAIKEYIQENKDNIKQEVRRQLQTKTGTSQFVSSFITGMLKASESEYRFKADFTFNSLND